MPGKPYSTRFILFSNGGPQSYFVPTGKTAVIKCVTAYNSDTAAHPAAITISGILAWSGSVPGVSPLVASNLTVVVTGGEEIKAIGGTGAVSMHASGFLLEGA